MLSLTTQSFAVALLSTFTSATKNVSYNNPILPGWHSDPSCVFVAELDSTTFCTTSSFMAFPGNPIFASKDLINWKLASNALSRVAQLPEIRTATSQQFAGMFANTLRYHKGQFYLISSWVNTDSEGIKFVLNTATDPFDDRSWTNLKEMEAPGYTIDPDVFFDDDGSVVVASSGAPIIACYLDLTTGNFSEPWSLWNGTGGANAEGPHLYKKDGYYYLLIAEGGTQIGHSATMARSKTLNGIWEPMPHNPLVSNKGADEYFQTVGHADLFQDASGHWWGVALSTRGGPVLYNESIFPMGRETVLYPISWPEGDWPVADQVRGRMSGPLPQQMPLDSTLGEGPAVGNSESIDFDPDSDIPSNWLFWRAPFDDSFFQVSPRDHPNTLQLIASRANLTGDAAFNASHEGLTGVFRRQEHTFFNYTVNLHLGFGTAAGDELGVSNFLNQDQHVDLGIVYLQRNRPNSSLEPHLRFRTNSVRAPMPEEVMAPVPAAWCKEESLRFRISPRNESVYAFFVAPAGRLHEEKLFVEYSTALIAGDGAGTGGLLGVYATTNGNHNHTFDGYVDRWRYEPVAQKIEHNVTIESV